MRFCQICLLMLLSYKATAQMSIDSLKKEDLISDFKIAVDILKNNHPNPFKFISESKFNQQVDSLEKELMVRNDIFGFISNFPTKLIKDVHLTSSLNTDLSEEIFKKLTYFPLPVFVEQGRMFVNIKNSPIPFSAEIIEINGIPTTDILKRLSATVDGKNPTTDRVENFGLKMSINYGKMDRYSIQYIDPSSKNIKKIDLAAISPSKYYYNEQKQVLPFNLAQMYRSNIYGEFNSRLNTGVITVNSFNLDEGYAYKEFSKFFKEANRRKCDRIIIDIRRNAGGNPSIAALLFSFIAREKSFSNLFKYKTKTIRLNNDRYRSDGNGRNLSDDDLQQEVNFFYQRFDKGSDAQYVGNSRLMEGVVSDFPRDKNAFDGEILVLVGSETISAAVYFASLVQRSKSGIIIGKETSSGKDATTAAWFAMYELPKTKTLISIPRSEIYFFNADHDSGRGLMPDIEIPIDNFLDYVKKGVDPEMTFALEN
ncbi:Peptidase family S41 [compost metagenome]